MTPSAKASARKTPIPQPAPRGKSKTISHAINVVATTPSRSAAPFSDRSGRKSPKRPPVIAAPIATSPAIRKNTSAIVHNSQPVRSTPPVSAQGRNKETISSAPPTPAIICPGPGPRASIALISCSGGRSFIFAVAGQGMEHVGGRSIRREEQLRCQLGGGHLERSVERRKHAEERQLATIRSTHFERPED